MSSYVKNKKFREEMKEIANIVINFLNEEKEHIRREKDKVLKLLLDVSWFLDCTFYGLHFVYQFFWISKYGDKLKEDCHWTRT